MLSVSQSGEWESARESDRELVVREKESLREFVRESVRESESLALSLGLVYYRWLFFGAKFLKIRLLLHIIMPIHARKQ